MGFAALAEQALAQYDIGSAAMTFLRHNENAVYRVEAENGNAYVLRLHMPREGLSVTHRPDWIDGEMAFLHLLRKASDIAVQAPVRTKNGDLLCALPEGQLATMLTWLPGEAMDQNGAEAATHAYQAGMLTARLHSFVLSHPETAAISRPWYDAERMHHTLKAIAPGVALGMFDEVTFALLQEAGAQIAAMMTSSNDMPGMHGLAHSDLSPGNLIVHGNTVSAIDFSLCGHGPLLFDVGGLMAAFDQPPLRRATLAGYRSVRPLHEAQERQVEGYFLTGILFFMGMHLQNPHVRAWFSHRLPLVIQDYVVPFVADTPFLASLL